MHGEVVSLMKNQFPYNISPPRKLPFEASRVVLSIHRWRHGHTPTRLEVGTQTIGLVISIVVGMTFFAGLSAMIYMALPASVMEETARHGRFSGLGARERTTGGTAGNARSTMRRALQGQSV
jgi:hypothetical protein